MQWGSASMTCVLYLAHDLDDPAIWRRVNLLRLGGADVTLAGFRRGSGDLPGDALVLGQTHNARMLQRAFEILRQRSRLHKSFAHLPLPDVILCRNLEMLALAVPLRRYFANSNQISLVYEVLDIHRVLVGPSWKALGLRWVERRLCRDVDRLLVSSPAFLREHFATHGQANAPALVFENKVLAPDRTLFRSDQSKNPTGPTQRLNIGWFGILRCRFSLDCLDQLTRARPGRYRVILRGRPALDALPDFHSLVEANPDLIFQGSYSYPDDLAQIYSEADVAWLVDQYDAGSNSNWLLPNRLYESGLNRVPPIALAGTEIAKRIGDLGIGLVLQEADVTTVVKTMDALDPEALERLRRAQNTIKEQTWMVSTQDARELVEQISPDISFFEHQEHAADRSGVLIVVPTLNEAAHIAGVIDGLAPFLERRRTQAAPVRLVIADGGSYDGTLDIVKDQIAAFPQFDIRILDNPARLQGAGINLACATFGTDMTWLIRLDAHSVYPEDYMDILLTEACQTDAGSVVVGMNAVGSIPVQRAIALTQNSRLGNGGSAHRSGASGQFVDHGHHALMRLDAFRSVQGYDESFSHNEDAELDLRLAQAGYRIWLTSRTRLDYVPRRNIAALARQYFNFGRGRARTTLKHRLTPRLRQMAMIALAPLAALAALFPVSLLFVVPATFWLSACLIAGTILALARRDPLALSAAPIAATMHLAWSTGFWSQLCAKQKTLAPISVLHSGGPLIPLPTDHVAVAVCTFQRPMLTNTLRTLEEQILPSNMRLSIIVIDNDKQLCARDTVDRFAKQSRHEVVYRHAPYANISIARNAALEEADRRDWRVFAFIDDDELAPPDWLNTLVVRLAQGDADVVVGPIRAIYTADAPQWMQSLRIHDTHPELGPDGRPIAGHSCNVIMNLGSDALSGRRFDLARGVSGGEDTAFFNDAVEDGARLAIAPRALLDEPVTASRARLSWLLKRRFRMGQTHGSLLRSHKSMRGRLITLPLAFSKVIYCAAFAVLSSPFSVPRNANLLRGALHFGTVASLIGIRDVAIYGQGDSKKHRTTSI